MTHQFAKMNEENDLGGNGDTRNKSQENTKNEENKSSSQVSKAILFSVTSEKNWMDSNSLVVFM